MRKPPHLRNADDEEGECYQTLQQETLPEDGGRYARPEPTNIGETNVYPQVAPTPLTATQPDHSFAPDRDRVDEPTTMKFGANLNYLPGTPNWSAPSELEPPPANSDPCSNPGEQIDRDGGSFSHPNIKKVGAVFLAYAGRGMTREKIGEYNSFNEALAAVRDAEAVRRA
jgi:hypothetical protein